MRSFEFCNPVRIYFGNGIRKKIGETLEGIYTKILLVCNQGPFHENGLYDEVVSDLEAHGIQVFHMKDVEQNPKLSSIREGTEICRRHEIPAVMALGSGSAIDCVKGIASAAAMGCDPYDLYWGKRVAVTKSLDMITIPTMAATGSEINNGSVAVNEETKEKYYFTSEFPKMAFLDPEITLTVPKHLTIWAGMDILSHTFEYYFNGDDSSEFQTALSEALISSTMRGLEVLSENPLDLKARGEILWCASMTWGFGLTKIGRGEADMACHGIEESFSGYFDTHHGACLGVLTPRWMRRVCGEHPGIFARFARNIMNVREADDKAAARMGVEAYVKWLKSVGAPDTYFDIGDRAFSDEELERVAETACRIYGGGVGHLHRFDKKETLELLQSGRTALSTHGEV